MINRLQRFIFHPFFFAIYPPLFLLFNNLQQLKLLSGFRAVLFSLIFSTILFFLLRLITKNIQRSALLTSFIFILFFSYGPLRSIIPNWQLFGAPLSSHRYMFILWGLASGAIIWWLGWKLRNPLNLNAFMNVAGFFLVVVVVVQGFQLNNHLSSDQQDLLNVQTVTDRLKPPPLEQQPDIYYIIFDGYSSSKVLKDEYNIDNSDFINELEKRGFYVAECSRSNYDNTADSVPSSLNMDYIPPVGEKLLPNLVGAVQFAPYMRFNAVRNTLVEIGYKTVTFDTYYPWLDVTNSDVFISPRGKMVISFKQIIQLLVGGTNDYEEMLMDMTPLVRRNAVLNLLHIPTNESNANIDNIKEQGSIQSNTNNLGEQKIIYDLFVYDLDKLGTVPSIPGKKFIYAHLLTTHRPYLFAADGTFHPDQSNIGYADSIYYSDKVILDAVDKIIANSNPKPVIIIQGDHSSRGSEDRFGILNAYYLPGINQDILYPTISPVNSFRIVFNQYFGAKLPLLPDLSYLLVDVKDKFVSILQEATTDCGK